MRSVLAIAATLALSTCQAHPRGLVLLGATVVDPGGVVTDAVVVIDGDRLVAVGPQSHVPLPKGFRIVSLRGKFIVPTDAPTDAAAIEALRAQVKAGQEPLAAFNAEVRRRQEARQLGRGGAPRLLQAGGPADLLVLEADPLADFGNLARIHRRLQAGRLETQP